MIEDETPTHREDDSVAAIWREIEQLREHEARCRCSRCCFNVTAIAEAARGEAQQGPTYLGIPVRVDGTMPKDAVLLATPPTPTPRRMMGTECECNDCAHGDPHPENIFCFKEIHRCQPLPEPE